jgi:hypothetical protein
MSFEWSAGDIAIAIVLIVKVVRALDDAEGAAADYREAVAFLVNLKRTLEPLQTFSALGAYPTYRDEIKKCVEGIKAPIENCLAVAAKFDPSFATTSKKGRHRNVGRKLEWRFNASKKVATLRKNIEGHILGLNNLLNTLTLSVLPLLVLRRHP